MNGNRKPLDSEIDVYGLSHQGKVRTTNQDHFLLGSVHKKLQIRGTSITDTSRLQFGDERLAFLAMVADGVGGTQAGEEASVTALDVVTQYITDSLDCYYSEDSHGAQFIETLQNAAQRSHQAVLAKRKKGEGGKEISMATTLTVWMGVWPWYYILQVGDSRYYLFHNGTLTQLSRDQTVAQELIDKGVFTRSVAERSHLSNVLSSAIGGEEAEPVVTRLHSEWGMVHLLCTDGLTKHVSEEQIAERLRNMTSAKEVCEQLLEDALDDGGSDNITIIVGRAVEQNSASP